MKNGVISARLSLFLIMILFIISACKPMTNEELLEKATKDLENGSTSDAIEILESLLSSDEQNIDVHRLLIDAYMSAEAYKEANHAIDVYFDLLTENLDTINVTSEVQRLKDYKEVLIEQSVLLDFWAYQIEDKVFESIGIYPTYYAGESIYVEPAYGFTLYYTLDGSDPIKNGSKVYDYIEIPEGLDSLTLKFVYKNELGQYGEVTEKAITIDLSDGVYSDADNINSDNITDEDAPKMPELNLASGSYSGPLIVEVFNYTDEEMNDIDIYYTIDGSDPNDYYSSFYGGYIYLSAGTYKVNLVAYNWELDLISDIASYDYVIETEGSITAALYDLTDDVNRQLIDMFNYMGNFGYYVEPVVISSISQVDPTNLPDMIVGNNNIVDDLVGIGLLMDVSNLLASSEMEYDYLANALSAGMYKSGTYMMPLTIRPTIGLYSANYSETSVTVDDIKGEAESYYDYRFIYPADRSDMLLGVYYGLGGSVLDTYNEVYTIDVNIMAQALSMIKELPDYGIGVTGQDNELLEEAIEYFAAEYVVADMSIEDDIYNYYMLNGPFPLPNGYTAKYYNSVTGIMISNTLATDPDAQEKRLLIRDIYNYMYDDSIGLSYIAQVQNALPAFREMALEGNALSYMEINAYIAMIEGGVTAISPNSLDNIHIAVNNILAEYLSGDEEAASVAETIAAEFEALN